jgi:hypothetical protein
MAYKHFQGLCSLQALSWLVRDNALKLSHGCESVVEAVRVLYAHSLFGHPCDLYMHSHGLYSTLTTSTGTCMASTTLAWPTLILKGACKHFHTSATVSRPLVAFLLLYKHSYGLYMHSHGLNKHSVVGSCQLFFKIYIFTAHIVQKLFLEVMRVLVEKLEFL